ncbi:MAG TPA: hypothetical protein VFM05_11185 [Candidatus Saccharimonadales bacterium]|nr:hypothetical protein [Candidatus Saccharimonadales bacterium]
MGPRLQDGRAGAGPQNPQRPQKEPTVIVVREKDNYRACVWREWRSFNDNVAKIEKAAQKKFEASQVPWWLEILKNMGPSSVRDRTMDWLPTVIAYNEMQKEIREGRQKAAETRDQEIKKNCKK